MPVTSPSPGIPRSAPWTVDAISSKLGRVTTSASERVSEGRGLEDLTTTGHKLRGLTRPVARLGSALLEVGGLSSRINDLQAKHLWGPSPHGAEHQSAGVYSSDGGNMAVKLTMYH